MKWNVQSSSLNLNMEEHSMRKNISRIHRDPHFVKVIGHVWVHVDFLSPLIEHLPYSNLKRSCRYDERNMESNRESVTPGDT